MSTQNPELIQKFSKQHVDLLQMKVPTASEEVVISYLFAKAHGKAVNLEIDSYPDGLSYVRLKSGALDPYLNAWKLNDGSYVVVRGDQRPEDAMKSLNYLEDNVYRDTIALRSGHLSKLLSMYGDLSGQFSGPGRLGSMMSNISGKHEQVIALWRADRSGGCAGVLGALAFLATLFFIVLLIAIQK